jgi:hypothetical protein
MPYDIHADTYTLCHARLRFMQQTYIVNRHVHTPSPIRHTTAVIGYYVIGYYIIGYYKLPPLLSAAVHSAGGDSIYASICLCRQTRTSPLRCV